MSFESLAGKRSSKIEGLPDGDEESIFFKDGRYNSIFVCLGNNPIERGKFMIQERQEGDNWRNYVLG